MAVAHKRKKLPLRQRRAPQAERVSEIIGRTGYALAQLSIYKSRASMTVDDTRTDYEFYDKLRRGKQPGYKLGALFAKRIEHIFSVWVLGRGVTVALAESGNPDSDDDPRNYTDGLLSDFIEANHTQLMAIKEDVLGLGDQYIFINPDGTLSVPSPDTVEEERDPLDYRVVTKVTITTKLPKATIIDEYRRDGRTVTVKTVDAKGAQTTTVESYANLLGRLNYVHIAHGMSGNEINGHSIHEDLLKLYDQYDDVIHKQLDGAKLLGNPILAFVGMENLAAVIDANKPQEAETYVDRDGNEVTRTMLNVDSNSVMLIGKGGDGKFISPPTGFTADTQQALKTLFLLLLDRTGIPEFIWGNEMSSARASSDTQMMQWAHDIEGMQNGDERWLIDLCDLWLATKALTDPRIVQDALAAEWPPVLDENQELRLKFLEFVRRESLLPDKETLALTNLPVDNPAETVKQAQSEAKARVADEQQRMMAQAAITAKQRPVGEMGSGYNDGDTAAIVAGALRIVAGQ